MAAITSWILIPIAQRPSRANCYLGGNENQRFLEEERSIKFGSTSETQSSKRMLQKDSCCWSISYGRLSSVGQEEREKKGGKSLKVHYILSSLLCTVTKLQMCR